MITTETRGGLTYLKASDGILYNHRRDAYCGNSTYLLPGETADDYEEVGQAPAYTTEQYDAMVARLIHERYPADKETSLINNMLDDSPTDEHVAEYREYQAFRARCKQLAKDPALYVSDETVPGLPEESDEAADEALADEDVEPAEEFQTIEES